MEQVQSPTKRINVISLQIVDTEGKILQQGGVILRCTRRYAAQLLEAGTHTTTSKGKLKSYLNKSLKLHKNKRFIAKFDLSDKKAGHFQMNDSYSGKSYILIKRKEEEVTMVGKEVDKFTGKPVEHTIKMPKYQSVIASYPM